MGLALKDEAVKLLLVSQRAGAGENAMCHTETASI